MSGELVAAGAVGGAFGGILGAAGGAIAGKILAGHVDEAQKDVKKMINKNRSKGGCRVTLTDEFPISSLNSRKQAKI